MRLCAHVCEFMYACVPEFCVHACVCGVCLNFKYACMCIHVYVCVYTCACVCMCVCVCVCVCVMNIKPRKG